MRTDLTANFLAKMSSFNRAPIQLMVIHFENNRNVYLSDRDIVISGRSYQGIVDDWGTLSTVGEDNSVSGTQTVSITLWNGGTIPFSINFAIEDPTDIFVDLYQTFYGLGASDMAHIGTFVVQDPIEESEASALLTFDLVSVNMRYFGQVGMLLTRDRFPQALESDLNKPIDYIVGNAGRVQCLCSKKPPVTTIDRSVVRSTLKIETDGNLTELLFPASGTIQIDAELITYTSRGEYYFNASARGVSGTVAVEHSTGAEVILYGSHVDYVIGLQPVSNAWDVRVGGEKVSSGYQLVNDTVNKVRLLRFAKQPTYQDTEPMTTGTVYFDNTKSDNTALYAYRAYSTDYRASGALIKQGNTSLHIFNDKDEIAEQGVGEIVNVFLNITHWATYNYKTSHVNVYLGGYYVGRVTLPDQFAKFEIKGVTPIDHPHKHGTGGQHGHDNDDPNFDNTDPTHDHNSSWISSSRMAYSGDTNDHGLYYRPSNSSVRYVGHIKNFSDSSFSTGTNQLINDGTITFNYEYTGHEAYVDYIKVYWQRYVNGSWQTIHSYTVTDFTTEKFTATGLYIYEEQSHRLYIKWKLIIGSTTGANIGIWSDGPVLSMNLLAKPEIIQNTTGVTTYKDANGSVNNVDVPLSDIKDADDVEDYNDSTSRRELEVDEDASSFYTPIFTDQFDILDVPGLANFDWAQFKDLPLKLVLYQSTEDRNKDLQVVVTWCDLTVEYHKPRLKTTDDVTCMVIGDTDNRPDHVIQKLLTENAGVPASMLSSVYRTVYDWDDALIWHDTGTWPGDHGQWRDNGMTLTPPAGALFHEAASWYLAHGYFIDGVIPGDLSVKDALRMITWQVRSRMVWQNGKCQLVILRKSDGWNIAHDLTADEVRLQSLKVAKSNVADVVNKIDLFHTIDRLSSANGAGKYEATSSVKDTRSISKHGERVNDSLWLFDLVRRQGMADSLSEYYLWELGETKTKYTTEMYLNNFNLEKEDYITIDSKHLYFIKQLPVVIRELSRQIGSGKNKSINILKIIGHSIRQVFLYLELNENVIVNDDLDINFLWDQDFSDTVTALDKLIFLWGKTFNDDVVIGEEFSISAGYSQNENEQVIVGDALGVDIEIEINDQVTAVDKLRIAEELCFGTCGFGGKIDHITGKCRLPFGAKTEHVGDMEDILEPQDILEIAMGRFEEEDVQVDDGLCFGDGFGCKNIEMSGGFGRSSFGC